MTGRLEMHIEIYKAEVKAITQLLELLDRSEIDLTNEDYVDILRAISQGQQDAYIGDYFRKIYIDYEEEE